MPSSVAGLVCAIAALAAAQPAYAGGYAEAVMSANPTAYFQLNDTSGATAANTVASPAVTGTYFNSWGTAGTATTMLSGGTASTGNPTPTLMRAGPSLPGFASENYSVFLTGLIQLLLTACVSVRRLRRSAMTTRCSFGS